MSDETLELLKAALVWWEDGVPVPAPEDRKASEKMLTRAKEILGSGIDPSAVINSLRGFSEAVRKDPTHVAAYAGFVRAATALANARPAEAEAILGETLRWLLTSSSKVGKLQESSEIHEIEFKLRDARRKAHDRPKVGSADAVRVNLDRDSEGRVVTRRRGRRTFGPHSTSLSVLIPFGIADDDAEPLPIWLPVVALVLLAVGLGNVAVGNWHYAANGVLVGVGVLLVGVPLLIWAGEKTRGIAPGVLVVFTVAACVGVSSQVQRRNEVELPGAQRFGDRLNPLYDTWRPKLIVGNPIQHEWALSKLAVVEETGRASVPLRVDVLHDRLPANVRAAKSDEVLYVVIVRRLAGAAHELVLVWAVEPDDARVLARASFTGISRRVVENDALEWITRLRTE